MQSYCCHQKFGFMWTERHKCNTKEVTFIMRLLAPHAYLLSLLVQLHFFTLTTISIGQDALLFWKKQTTQEYHYLFALLMFAIIKHEETKSLSEFSFFVPLSTRHVIIFIFYPLYICTLLGKWMLIPHIAPQLAKLWSNSPPTLTQKQCCHARSLAWGRN